MCSQDSAQAGTSRTLHVEDCDNDSLCARESTRTIETSIHDSFLNDDADRNSVDNDDRNEENFREEIFISDNSNVRITQQTISAMNINNFSVTSVFSYGNYIRWPVSEKFEENFLFVESRRFSEMCREISKKYR